MVLETLSLPVNLLKMQALSSAYSMDISWIEITLYQQEGLGRNEISISPSRLFSCTLSTTFRLD